jgi:hypothetical protein
MMWPPLSNGLSETGQPSTLNQPATRSISAKAMLSQRTLALQSGAGYNGCHIGP